mgnify:CR=1 FL=1
MSTFDIKEGLAYCEKYGLTGQAETDLIALLERAMGAKPVKRDPSDIPENLDTAAFRIAWADWEQHRKEKRAKLTPTTRKRQLKSLSLCGPKIAIARIEQSIMNGWQGLFELRDGGESRIPTREYVKQDMEALHR